MARAPGAPARLRAVLFDLDGTLVDSEPTYYVDQPLHAVFAEADLLVAEGAAGFTAERAWALVEPLLAGGG